MIRDVIVKRKPKLKTLRNPFSILSVPEKTGTRQRKETLISKYPISSRAMNIPWGLYCVRRDAFSSQLPPVFFHFQAAVSFLLPEYPPNQANFNDAAGSMSGIRYHHR
jgi:hypothetical protein